MIYANIKQILQDLQSAIRQADSAALGQALQALDRVATERKGEIHPRLHHFLQNRSYDKARQFLEDDPDIPVGICGGGR